MQYAPTVYGQLHKPGFSEINVMDKILIQGGIPLHGEVAVSGAKNAALPILAATLLAGGKCEIGHVPGLRDVDTILRLIRHLGGEADYSGAGRIEVDNTHACGCEAPYDLVRTMRASILVLGPLLARHGRARVSLPGGCAIGARPVNLHLKALQELGARINIDHGYIDAQADKLIGNRIWFDISTVTGTENLMMAACLAKGETILENAACEPEVTDLAGFLNKMGANIQGAGTDCIVIQGVDSLKGNTYNVIPDRVEAATLMAAGAITGGDVKVKNCLPEHLTTIIAKFKEAGVTVIQGTDWVEVKSPSRLTAADVKTAPYPGFPTDMQAQFMAMMAVASGTSVITETVFENRFMHVLELDRMGADIKIEGHCAIVKGIDRLCGAPVMATDLRASASLVLAGLAASGQTLVNRIYHLDRGYENLELKLAGLGADIRRVA